MVLDLVAWLNIKLQTIHFYFVDGLGAVNAVPARIYVRMWACARDNNFSC